MKSDEILNKLSPADREMIEQYKKRLKETKGKTAITKEDQKEESKEPKIAVLPVYEGKKEVEPQCQPEEVQIADQEPQTKKCEPEQVLEDEPIECSPTDRLKTLLSGRDKKITNKETTNFSVKPKANA
jgi:hypothetical protein